MLWVGILVGVLVAQFASSLISWSLVAISIAALGGIHLISRQLGATFAIWLLVIAGALMIGAMVGRARGLRHLGAAEFQARMGNIKKVSRF